MEWIWPDDDLETIALDHAGFTYLIKNETTGRAYVGKKSFTARRGKKVQPSDWRRYWGSSAALKADIKVLGKECFSRSILSVHKTAAAMNYDEVAEQFKRDVLTARLADGSPAFYNSNIAGRWFARSLT